MVYKMQMYEYLPAQQNRGEIKYIGEMAERSNVPPWKGGVFERVPGVRISLSPQNKKHRRCDYILRECSSRSSSIRATMNPPPQINERSEHKLRESS